MKQAFKNPVKSTAKLLRKMFNTTNNYKQHSLIQADRASKMSWVNWFYCLLIVQLFQCSVLATDTSCLTWHYYNNARGQCECGYRLLYSSDGNQVEIRIDLCATSTGQEDDYYVSYCPLTHTVNSANRLYSEIQCSTRRDKNCHILTFCGFSHAMSYAHIKHITTILNLCRLISLPSHDVT